jgi:hypothetical protein
LPNGGQLTVGTAPVLVDINGDGVKEIVLTTREASGKNAFVIYNGALHKLVYKQWGTWLENEELVVEDLDNNGTVELLLRGNEYARYDEYDEDRAVLAAYSSDGNELWRKPISGIHYSNKAMIVADLDKNGKKEIILGGDGPNQAQLLCVMNHHGDVYKKDGASWPQKLPDYFNYAIVADANNDGYLDVIVKASVDLGKGKATIISYDRKGSALYQFELDSPQSNSMLATDLDGDDVVDIVFSSHYRGYVSAYSVTGSPVAGFPKRISLTPEPPKSSSSMSIFGEALPVIEDLDGDGDLELIAGDYLHVLDLSHKLNPAKHTWTMYRRNAARTASHIVERHHQIELRPSLLSWNGQ